MIIGLWALLVAVALLCAAAFVLLASGRSAFTRDAARIAMARWRAEGLWIGIGAATLIVHSISVNVVDPWIRREWLGGGDFNHVIEWVEGDAVRIFDPLDSLWLVAPMVWFYLVAHHAFVIAAPLHATAAGQTPLARRWWLSIAFTYAMAMPFFLFVPIDNPTIVYDLPSRLEMAIPGVDALFYQGTTIDNTLPSMHVGLATVGFLHGHASPILAVRRFATVYGPLVAFSVVFLQVHWFADVVGGVAVGAAGSWLAARVVRRYSHSTVAGGLSS